MGFYLNKRVFKFSCDSCMAELSTTFAIEDFGNKWILKLNEFRKNKLYCDVTLKTKGNEIQCHKVVLIACGGVFESSLAEGCNLKENIAEMSFDCASEALEAIIDFAYGGTMTMTSQNILLCLHASLELKLEEIKLACIKVIEEQVLKLFSIKDEFFLDLLDFLRVNTTNKNLCGCNDIEKVEDLVSSRISREHPELSSTYEACHAFITCAGLKIPAEQKEVSNVLIEKKHEKNNGANPFGHEEENEIVNDTLKSSKTELSVKTRSSDSSSHTVVPEVVVTNNVANPFGDEEENEIVNDTLKSSKTEVNVKTRSLDSSSHTVVPEVVVVKCSNPFGDEEETGSLETPKPLARRSTSPTTTRRKAPPPPPASPSLRERSATTSSKKSPPPRPKPPSVKQEKIDSGSSSFARSFGKTLRKSLRISKKSKKKSLEHSK